MRLTEKTEYGSFWTKNSKGVRETLLFKEEIMKLGQYEDIDENPEHLAKVKKALEIIKEKQVDMITLLVSFQLTMLDYYNEDIMCSSNKLTQEEYDLLKEVLL